jgi:hypothetical protein
VEGNLFPLRFFKTDLDKNIRSLDRVIAGETLGRMIRNGLLEVIIKGEFSLAVSNDEGAAAIRYGLGFGRVSGGILQQIEIQELAVVECLRYFIPFADIVKTLALRMTECTKPQMVGYLLEYLVSFALVANYSGESAANSIKAWQGAPYMYFQSDDSTQVFFPDHMCGPDIMYTCKKTKTVYIVQVKFLNRISKQEAVKACDTTDPERFYCKRNCNETLKGFEEKRAQLSESLIKLKLDGYIVQRLFFIHSGGRQLLSTPGALVISKSSDPNFFDLVGSGVWELLDSLRNSFQ